MPGNPEMIGSCDSFCKGYLLFEKQLPIFHVLQGKCLIRTKTSIITSDEAKKHCLGLASAFCTVTSINTDLEGRGVPHVTAPPGRSAHGSQRPPEPVQCSGGKKVAAIDMSEVGRVGIGRQNLVEYINGLNGL